MPDIVVAQYRHSAFPPETSLKSFQTVALGRTIEVNRQTCAYKFQDRRGPN